MKMRVKRRLLARLPTMAVFCSEIGPSGYCVTRLKK